MTRGPLKHVARWDLGDLQMSSCISFVFNQSVLLRVRTNLLHLNICTNIGHILLNSSACNSTVILHLFTVGTTYTLQAQSNDKIQCQHSQPWYHCVHSTANDQTRPSCKPTLHGAIKGYNSGGYTHLLGKGSNSHRRVRRRHRGSGRGRSIGVDASGGGSGGSGSGVSLVRFSGWRG